MNSYKGSGKNWYMGIDSSTQSVKFNVIDSDTGETIWQWQDGPVSFDAYPLQDRL